MGTEGIDQVRRFNRIVTQRVGALDEAFLARGRPLSEARLLWEIGAEGSDVRSLRSRLGLDSGYLSRMLRSLEHDGLVRVASSPSDGRVRTVVLTELGSAEWNELDWRSDAQAASILDPLSVDQQVRLLAAMAEVEHLLVASMVDIVPRDPAEPGARWCIAEYFSELARRFDSGFDPGVSRPVADHELTPPAGLLLVAALGDEPVGCGGLRFHGSGPAEIKRMWVAPAVRGLGLGRRILAELESRARQGGARTVQLDTNRALSEAIALYQDTGYREVAPFNDEPYAHRWFEKDLGPSDPDGRVGSVSEPAGSARLRPASGSRQVVPGEAEAGGQLGG